MYVFQMFLLNRNNFVCVGKLMYCAFPSQAIGESLCKALDSDEEDEDEEEEESKEEEPEMEKLPNVYSMLVASAMTIVKTIVDEDS